MHKETLSNRADVRTLQCRIDGMEEAVSLDIRDVQTLIPSLSGRLLASAPRAIERVGNAPGVFDVVAGPAYAAPLSCGDEGGARLQTAARAFDAPVALKECRLASADAQRSGEDAAIPHLQALERYGSGDGPRMAVLQSRLNARGPGVAGSREGHAATGSIIAPG